MGGTQTLLVICGSRRSPSRTRELANTALSVGTDRGLSVELLDLRDYPMELFDGREYGEYDDVTTDAIARVLEAEMYLIASPVYFGGMPGGLKNLIDHIPYEKFARVSRSAGLLIAGRDNRHHFVVDSQLRSILVYLGVDVATTSVFATEDDYDQWTLTNPTVERYTETVIEDTRSLKRR